MSLATCSLDYDGLGSIDMDKFEGKIGSTRFSSLATLQANTSEVHAVAVDMNIFASPPAFPANPYPAKPVVDLQLAAGSAAVDKGMVLVGINDGFSGAAPDLGAYEIGVAPPVYGPRSSGAGGAGIIAGVGGASGTGGVMAVDGGFAGAMGTGGGVGNAPSSGDASSDAGSSASKGSGCSCATVPSTGGNEKALIVLVAFALLRRSSRRRPDGLS
jgi:hypothetical protein